MQAGTRPILTSEKEKTALVGGHRDVADRHQPGAAADGRAVDAPDHRLRELVDLAHQVGQVERVLVVLLVGVVQHLAASSSGRRRRRTPCPRRSAPPPAARRSSRSVGEGLAQLADHHVVEGVADLGPVEDHLRHGAVALQTNRLELLRPSATVLGQNSGAANVCGGAAGVTTRRGGSRSGRDRLVAVLDRPGVAVVVDLAGTRA